MVRRLCALVAILAALFGPGRALAGVGFLCQMDRQVHATRCCDDVDGCCQITASPQDDAALPMVPPPPTVAVLPTPPAPLPPAGVRTVVHGSASPRGPPPDSRPPIYDRVCSWLI